jgi:arabinogalactan endo-1,4-beta-galactosidase
MKKYIFTASMLLVLAFSSCGDDDTPLPEPQEPVETGFLRAADISFLPEIESEGTIYYNNGVAEDVVTTLKNNGVNAIRIRLWKDPANVHSGMAEVKTLADRVRSAGMKVWLTVHYSDTWADPGNQAIPAEWSSLSFDALKTEVANYTSEILTEIHPDIFQIGNETNNGFLWPMGTLSSNQTQSVALFEAASQKIREQSPDTKIMLHFAGYDGADWFFSKMTSVDYDYIGLSYYPMYHGKSFTELGNAITTLGQTYDKKVVIAETAYPFTLGWDDWTNNILGTEDQLIPGWPATPTGQNGFLHTLRSTVESSPYGLGFAYWGTEWIAFRGEEATNGSSYENQALYDFDHNALPAMGAFAE